MDSSSSKGVKQNLLFHCDRVNLGVSRKLKPYMCFDYVTIYHIKMKGTEFNVKNIKNFRIEWRES